MVPRILIADDQEVVTKALRTILECEARFTVCGVATNGPEALIKARELRPDLVILDLAMPVMNGLDAAREIAKIQPNTPVLLYTMTDVPQVRVEAASVGIREVVAEAAGPEPLLKAVERALNGDAPIALDGSASVGLPLVPTMLSEAASGTLQQAGSSNSDSPDDPKKQEP
jgi:DNA-binding NarL/FixJ family response regulator